MRLLASALVLALTFTVGCSKTGDTNGGAPSAPSASASSAPLASARPAPAASSAAPVVSAAPQVPSLTAMAACERVQKSGLGKLCEAKPPIPPSVESVQLTFAPSAKYPHETFAGFMTFRTAAELEQALTAFRAEPVSKKRKPPIFVSNAKALVIAVADGEIAEPDRLRKAVEAL